MVSGVIVNGVSVARCKIRTSMVGGRRRNRGANVSKEEATSLEEKVISGCSWRWSDGERKSIFVVVHGGGPRPQIGIDRADNEGFLVPISHDGGRLCSPTRCCGWCPISLGLLSLTAT
ncbi:hypothetical protein L1887_30261 [Cichorium endivia]|nr:hypothetical protein L1887_30261 [Cichorium endivia]